MLHHYFNDNKLKNPDENSYLYKRLKQKSTLGFYFHIPFCIHLCPYCDFVKTAKFSTKDVGSFFDKIYLDLENFLKNIPLEFNQYYPIITLYFGGGTPGIFKGSFYAPIIEMLQSKFKIEEITIEANPLKNLSKNVQEYYNLGINRMTLGAQSLDDKVLNLLGRSHTEEMVINNIREIKNANINEIQVDFITGLKKGIREKDIRFEIEKVLAAGATGISSYGLTIEEKTKFFGSDYSSEDEAYDDYFKILEIAKDYKLSQYETSNFGQFESCHNNLYWHGFPYIGFGTGAHGLMPATEKSPFGERYSVGNYQKLEERELGNFNLNFLKVDEKDRLFELQFEENRTFINFKEETIFTLLRTPKGIPKSLGIMFWGENYLKKINDDPILSLGIKNSMIYCNDNGIIISENEKIRGDYWTERFVSLV